MATKAKMIFGVQAASMGGKSLLVLKMVLNLSVRINKAAIINPMAR